MTAPDQAAGPRDVWRDLGWGVSRGVALACLPLLISVLPGRLPLAAADPRLSSGAGANLAILGIGAALGAATGLCRPLTRTLGGSLALGVLLAELGLLLVRLFAPRPVAWLPFRPFGRVLVVGLLLGLALYLGALHRRGQQSSLAG